MLLKFSKALLRESGVDVRYEDAVPLGDSAPRAGAFPHVYPGKLSRPQCDYACLVDAIRLELDPAGGTHIFPRHAFSDSHEEDEQIGP